MEEAIKVQEEFENLIEQLERLKNINELTSANAENAQLVISNIEAFIQSTNEFKNKIDQDVEQKSESIQQLIESLRLAINSYENQSIKIQDGLNSSLDGFKTNINEKFREIDNSLKMQIEDIHNENQSLKEVISYPFGHEHLA
jgi:ABC-type transporter Mla subunit MlaD